MIEYLRFLLFLDRLVREGINRSEIVQGSLSLLLRVRLDHCVVVLLLFGLVFFIFLLLHRLNIFVWVIFLLVRNRQLVALDLHPVGNYNLYVVQRRLRLLLNF